MHEQAFDVDLVVVGGGLAGTSAAVTAARSGLRVVLVQDRPVLGGNASSEVRLWVLGATSHLGNNNRWSREGGFVDEVMVENMYRNPEGNPLILDSILLEKVVEEKNLTTLLNTSAYEVSKCDGTDEIASVRAFCSQNSTSYLLKAPLFCDASGDGVLGFLAGAAFRMGAEPMEEFGEKMAPDEGYGELLGHSLYFYTKDVGRPVRYVPPSFALDDIKKIPRWRQFSARDQGCSLWWIEYGGRLDTVHDTEAIKWELWRVVYGVWDHIKNSGEFPEAGNLTLEWVGHVPGKRESRRFEGDYMIRQQDVVEQRRHEDAVSFGGWALDLHPADGVYSERPGCDQWHSKGLYQIPYRSMYSRNVPNLFLAGRIISASHVAFGSTRVMATCGLGAEVVGLAAEHCIRDDLKPRDLLEPERMKALQLGLQRIGHWVPHVEHEDDADLARAAEVRFSSEYVLHQLPPSDDVIPLDVARGMFLPLTKGRAPAMTFTVRSARPTTLSFQLRTSSREGGFTPDTTLAEATLSVDEGQHDVTVDFGVSIADDCYGLVALQPCEGVSLVASDVRVTGVLAVRQKASPRVSVGASQIPDRDLGVDGFEFWTPERRPNGKNMALRCDPPIVFDGRAALRWPDRPTVAPNAWVASLDDRQPNVELQWNVAQRVRQIVLTADTDRDHPMETVLMGHPESTMPFCVRRARVFVGDRVVASIEDNHATRMVFELDETTDRVRIEVDHPSDVVPASLFRIEVRETCFDQPAR